MRIFFLCVVLKKLCIFTVLNYIELSIKNTKLMMKQIGILLCCMGLFAFSVQAQQINTTPSDSVQQVESLVKISYADNIIKVSNAPVNSKLEIYNIVGSQVKVIDIIQPSGEYRISLPKGFYVARLESIARKILVR